MLNLENKDYDLNTLFSFEVLKEILLKLARAQVNLEEKVENIINIYKNKDNPEKIDDFNNFETEENMDVNEKDITDNEEEDNSNINPKQSEITNLKKENVDSELKDKKDNDNEKENDNKNRTDNNKQNRQNELNKQNENTSSGDKNNSTSSDKNSSNIKNVGLSLDLIKNMSKTIKQNKEKISFLDKEIKALKKELNESKNKDNDNDNDYDSASINKKINELNDKISELEDKLENCEVKCTNFDVMTMFKDSGDGSIDATKVMVKALEEKVFKKIEMVENRTKNKVLDNSYINDKLELVINKIEKDRQNIEKLFNLTGRNKELIDELKNEMNEKSNTIKNNEESIEKLKKKLSDAKEKLNKKINEINDKINNHSNDIEELKNNISGSHLFKLGLGDSQVDKEIIDNINLKINDLRKKVNDMENSMKLYFENNQFDDLDTQIKNMKVILDKKITKDDLKDLYNLHLSDLDEINDSNNKIYTLNEQLKDSNSNIQGIIKKLDNLSTNLSLLQAYQNSGANIPTSNQPIIDFSKFVDNQKLTDTIKPIVKEMEKMFQEVYSLRRELSDVQNLNKDLVKQTNLDKLEERLIEKINELKTIFNKKFLDKAEHYKTVKNLEAQIKVQVEENKKDADGWIMAKRPLKCFNCATCESNIKNVTPTSDYLPWNKYPPGDRIYRMGQGFSHMLQMMTTEFVKSIEKNAHEAQNDNEQSYKNLNLNNINERLNTNSNVNSEKALLGLSVNNKQQQIIDDSQIMQRKSGKIRLPLMNSKFIKNKKVKNTSDIPVSDEERDNFELFDKHKIVNSPKIVKIMKKKAGNMFGFNETNDNNNINTEINNNINYGDNNNNNNLYKSHDYKS